MPPKKKKAGKGKAAKKKKDTPADQNKTTCNLFLKAYIKHCNDQSVLSCAAILQECRRCIEEDQLINKFILEETAKVGANGEKERPPSVPPADDFNPGISLKPVLKALEEIQYPGLVQIHVWRFQMREEIDSSAACLALYLESKIGINVKLLELKDNNISQWAMDRISRALPVCALSVLVLDHNWMPDSILSSLCNGLVGNRVLQCLSLNYCMMTETAGLILGPTIVTTLIKDLSLSGNMLGCEGTQDLISPLLHLYTTGEPLPPLAKILLQDNSIDAKGKGGTFGPVICMRAFRRLLTSNPNFEEIDLEYNHIGDAAGREILHAMQQRKEAGYPSIRMTVTHRMNPVTFASILDLSTTYGKKARGKKKKAKK